MTSMLLNADVETTRDGQSYGDASLAALKAFMKAQGGVHPVMAPASVFSMPQLVIPTAGAWKPPASSAPMAFGGGASKSSVIIGPDGNPMDIEDPAQSGLIDIGGGTFVQPSMLGLPSVGTTPVAKTTMDESGGYDLTYPAEPIPPYESPTYGTTITATIKGAEHSYNNWDDPAYGSSGYSSNSDYITLTAAQNDQSFNLVGEGEHYGSYGSTSTSGCGLVSSNWDNDFTGIGLEIYSNTYIIGMPEPSDPSAPDAFQVTDTFAIVTINDSGAWGNTNSDGYTSTGGVNSSHTMTFGFTDVTAPGTPQPDFFARLDSAQDFVNQSYVDIGIVGSQVNAVIQGESIYGDYGGKG